MTPAHSHSSLPTQASTLATAAVAVLIIVVAAALRLPLISGQRFHQDEALYATWARHIATGEDIWLAAHPVDKPPLYIYILAALFGTVGASEEIARIPNMIASLCTIALVFMIAREVYHDACIATLAACALALSPMAMLFSATAFMDPSMVNWMMAALWLALRRKTLPAGLAAGMSLATKPDALLLMPLLLLPKFSHPGPTAGQAPTALEKRHPNVTAANSMGRVIQVASFVAGCAIPLAAIMLWTALRPQPHFLVAGLSNFGGLSLLAPEYYGERLAGWLDLTRALSSDWLLALAFAGAPLLAIGRSRDEALFLWAFTAYWLGIHTALNFPIWDRFMLPLAPVSVLVIAHSAIGMAQRPRLPVLRAGLAGLLLLLLFLPALGTLHDKVVFARDFHRTDGIEAVGQFFWAVDTTATVLYFHDLSWGINFYTFGRVLDRRWIEDERDLAEDCSRLRHARRFLALADWELNVERLSRALSIHSLRADPVFVVCRPDGSPAVHLFFVTDIPSAINAKSR